MDITEAGNKYLKPLISLIKGEHNKQTFEKYLYGLMLENSNFSTLNINEHTEEKELSQLYYFLDVDYQDILEYFPVRHLAHKH